MSPHLPAGWVDAFVAGTLSEARAEQVALHLDACPACLARVTAADPLASLWAAAPDPEPPPALAGAIRQALRAPPRDRPAPPAAPTIATPAAPAPWRELLLGGTLLATAAALALWIDMPLAAFVEEPGLGWQRAAQTWRALARASDAVWMAWRGPLVALWLGGCGAAATAAWGLRHNPDLRSQP